MTWIKLANNTTRHPKVAQLSDKAFRVWVSSLCYAGEFLTDGVLPVAFLVTVKRVVQDEILDAGLWKSGANGTIEIHDYLHHQTRKDDVEDTRARNREKAAKYRAKMKVQRGDVTRDVTGDVTGDAPRTLPTQIQRIDTDTERREQKQQNGHAAAPLIMNSLAYEKRKQQCTFVGARLEVPHGLHADLRKQLGGQNADAELLAWYRDLDEELEASGEPILPDVFRWLKARLVSWKQATGERTAEQIIAALAARDAKRKAVQ